MSPSPVSVSEVLTNLYTKASFSEILGALSYMADNFSDLQAMDNPDAPIVRKLTKLAGDLEKLAKEAKAGGL
jgi:hypothetical protein